MFTPGQIALYGYAGSAGPTYRLKFWNGTAWDSPVKFWDGSTWRTGVKFWDGSSWQL